MYDIYTIQAGDTLSGIADKFNTSIQVLYEINNNSPENFKVGSKIVVPVMNQSNFDYYEVKKGDNLYKIGQMYGISSDDLASINGLNPNEFIYEGQMIMVPKNEAIIIVTKQNDTLETIANQLGADIEDILEQNKTIYLLPDQMITYKASNSD